MNGADPDRPFPVLYSSREQDRVRDETGLRSVPWSLLASHERQALENHDQTLKRLAERGGLCPSEMVAVLEDRKWQSMDLRVAIARIQELLEVHRRTAQALPKK